MQRPGTFRSAAVAATVLTISAAVPLAGAADTSPLLGAATSLSTSRPVPNPPADPCGPLGCSTVMPGGDVSFPGFACTWNFLWNGSDGQRYMGTAGHCTFDVPLGTPATSGPGRPRVGVLVYKRHDPFGRDKTNKDDFALVRLDPGVKATGSVRLWGGPTGTYSGIGDRNLRLRHVGYGLGVSAVAPARRALATAVTSPDLIYFVGAVNFSDSGSPVLTEDGQAVGWITRLLHSDDVVRTGGDVGTMALHRITPSVAMAERTLRIRLQLNTSPNAVPPLKG